MGFAAKETADALRRTEVLEDQMKDMQRSFKEFRRETTEQHSAQMTVTERLTQQVQSTDKKLQQQGERLNTHTQCIKHLDGAARKTQSTLKRFYSALQTTCSDDDELDGLDLDALERNAVKQARTGSQAGPSCKTTRECEVVLRRFCAMHKLQASRQGSDPESALLLNDLDIDALSEADIVTWRNALKQHKTPDNEKINIQKRAVSKHTKEPYIATTCGGIQKKWRYVVFCDRWITNSKHPNRQTVPMLHRFNAAFDEIKHAVAYRNYVLKKMHAEIKFATSGNLRHYHLVFN